MALPQVIEGTTEEIITVLQGGAFAGRKARVIFEPEEDFTDNLPDPPDTVRDADHLKQLLLEGLQSGPATPMTEQDWEDIRRQVRSRVTRRKGQPSNNA